MQRFKNVTLNCVTVIKKKRKIRTNVMRGSISFNITSEYKYHLLKSKRRETKKKYERDGVWMDRESRVVKWKMSEEKWKRKEETKHIYASEEKIKRNFDLSIETAPSIPFFLLFTHRSRFHPGWFTSISPDLMNFAHVQRDLRRREAFSDRVTKRKKKEMATPKIRRWCNSPILIPIT